MPHNEDVYYQAGEDGNDSQRFSSMRIFKVGAAVVGGACLVLLCMVGVSVLIPSLQGTSAAESTNLLGLPTSLRASSIKGIGQGFGGPTLASLPGPAKWKELGLASIEAANRCDRDVSANARLQAAIANMDQQDLVLMAKFTKKVQQKAATSGPRMDAPYGLQAGMVGPVVGVWDPFGFSSRASEGELLFYREAELKHGRVCMLAVLGFYVQEKFHPLFGGDIDVPSIQMPGVGDLALFWPAVFVALGVPEIASIGRIDYATQSDGFSPALKQGLEPGAIGFDPLGLKPSDPVELLKRQNQEILHGRLAMIAAAGAIAQEVFTQQKLNMGGIYGTPEVPIL